MTAQAFDVLVVDDEPQVCELIAEALGRRSLTCRKVVGVDEARGLLEDCEFRVVVCDVVLAGMSGIDLLRWVGRCRPQTAVVLITGRASIEGAKQALREGAMDYLEKPVDLEALADRVAEVARRATPGEAELFTAPEALARSMPATHDGLTGLLTPRALNEQLTELRLAALRSRRNCALLRINVDSFAEVNRMFGYAFGDEVLWQLAGRIRAKCGGTGLLCRNAGDEFTVALADTGESEGLKLAEQIRDLVARMHVEWKGHPITVTISIGLAETGPGFALTESELMEHARRALVAVKLAGGKGILTYSQLERQAQAPGDPGGGAVALAAEELTKFAEQAAKVDRQLRMACLESVRALVSTVEAKDPYTRRHSENVAYYAEQFARHMGLPSNLAEAIRVAALVHDIGKISVPDTVLTKPSRLTDAEFELVKQHASVGAGILEKISLLRTESLLVRHHHENWDGSGYPAGLTGEEIPIGARVIRLADALDAMLMRRTYKDPYPVEQVIAELERGAGVQFDPSLANQALGWIRAAPDRLILPSDEGQPEQDASPKTSPVVA